MFGEKLMVTGIDSFRAWFKGYEDHYVIIGGTACDILMSEGGLLFRATKDLDMVLIVEAIDYDFGKKFWDYIKEAGYRSCNRSSGNPEFYRFSYPKSDKYPAMIELFARKLNIIKLPKDAVLTPLHLDDELSSLSAILLDDDYYYFMKNGKINVDGISVLEPMHIIPFKAKAWLDLTNRKNNGEHVDSKNIRKHKNDVFRLSDLVDTDVRIPVSKNVYKDICVFIEKMSDETVDVKQLGVRNKTKDQILKEIKDLYVLQDD